jgi:hypothetical protein
MSVRFRRHHRWWLSIQLPAHAAANHRRDPGHGKGLCLRRRPSGRSGLGVPAGEAFARLRAYAYSQDRRLADVAGDIVARRLRLPRDQHPGDGT